MVKILMVEVFLDFVEEGLREKPARNPGNTIPPPVSFDSRLRWCLRVESAEIHAADTACVRIYMSRR